MKNYSEVCSEVTDLIYDEYKITSGYGKLYSNKEPYDIEFSTKDKLLECLIRNEASIDSSLKSGDRMLVYIYDRCIIFCIKHMTNDYSIKERRVSSLPHES